MNVILAGGGIGGLTAALWLHRVGTRCRVYEAAQEYNPVGVGINLQPHAVKVLSQLGLQAALLDRGVVVEERAFFSAHGQLIYREPVGRFAGQAYPHLTVLRAELHDILLGAVIERLGPDAVVMGHRCTGIAQNGVEGFRHIFLTAAASLSLSLVGIILLTEKPLRGVQPS